MRYIPLRRLFFIELTVLLSCTHVSSSLFSRPSHLRPKEDTNDARRNERILDSKGASPGLERCLEEKIFSERVEIGTQCICKDKTGDDISDEDKGVVLICSDECAFCNDERTICGLKSEEALYDAESGSKIGMGQVFEYLKFDPIVDSLSEHQIQAGDGVIIGIEELGCKEENIDNKYWMDRCSTCNVYFAGTKCNFCEVIECGNTGSGIFAPVMDCTNIQENAIFDFCENISIEDDSLFQAFRPDQFQRCLPMQNLEI